MLKDSEYKIVILTWNILMLNYFEWKFITMRTIKHKLSAPTVNMGGILLEQAIPAGPIQQVDPFILLHHWKNSLPGGQKQQDLGVGPHPHRGFSPVTLIFKGGVHHRDSLGNSSENLADGVQWMNSGSGIIHSERPISSIAEKGGEFEFIQLWINVPASMKMNPPEYFSLHKQDFPAITKQKQISVTVISGKYQNIVGPAKSNTSILILRLDGNKSETLTIPIPDNFNTCIYQLGGEFIINNDHISHSKQLTVFNNDGKNISISCTREGSMVLMAGLPIDEPVVSYGPFVMNTYQEIREAVRDYQTGQFGEVRETFSH